MENETDIETVPNFQGHDRLVQDHPSPQDIEWSPRFGNDRRTQKVHKVLHNSAPDAPFQHEYDGNQCKRFVVGKGARNSAARIARGGPRLEMPPSR